MTKIYSTILLLSVTLLANAQAPFYAWGKQAGASGNDESYAIAVDAAGNSYITGGFGDTARFGNITLVNAGPGYKQTFVAKYDANGNCLWAKQGGCAQTDQGQGIAVDNQGNVFITGYYNFSAATFGTQTLPAATWDDIFVVKYDPNGNVLWAKAFGGSNNDYGYALKVDASNNLYLTGNFYGNCTFGTTTLTSAGWGDIFAAKIDGATGNAIWAVKAGASGDDGSYGIDVDASGNSYITGGFKGTTTFGSAGSLTSTGGRDIFVAKIDPAGNFVWVKKGGGTNDDDGRAVRVDAAGNVNITGYFYTSATFGTTTLTALAAYDVCIVRYDSAGNQLWAVSYGGWGNNKGFGMCLDSQGQIYVVGSFEQTIVFGTTSLPTQGIIDVFVAKINSTNGAAIWALQGGGEDADEGFGIGIDGSEKLYFTGYFQNDASFGPLLIANPLNEVFIAKLDNTLSVYNYNNPLVSVSLYPNPTVNSWSVQLTDANANKIINATVYDLSGRVVLTEQNVIANQISIDAEHLTSGVYQIELTTLQGKTNLKAIKQ